jgi:hypothetical protein
VRVGLWKQETDSLANNISPAEVAKAKLINKTRVFLMTEARFYRCGRMTTRRRGHDPTLGCVQIGLNMIYGLMGKK